MKSFGLPNFLLALSIGRFNQPQGVGFRFGGTILRREPDANALRLIALRLIALRLIALRLIALTAVRFAADSINTPYLVSACAVLHSK